MMTSSVTRRRHGRLIPGIAASAAICSLALTGISVPAAIAEESAGSPPVSEDAPHTHTVDWLVSQLTPAEKVSLIHGGVNGAGDPDAHGQAGYLPAITRLGIPEMRHVDALGINVQADTTSSPSRIGIASSFSRELLNEYGTFVGNEGLAADVDLLYGPQADLARTPSWSRNNTAYSEDAYLASELMSEEISGIQGTGLLSQVKHVGMYNGQAQATPSIVEGQAAHEIYLAPAEQAAADGVSSMMCSYATFQIKDDARYSKSDYACENSVMMNDIIKNDWDFPGFITSDYNALKTTSSIISGVDQEFATNYLTAATLLPLIDTTSADYNSKYADAVDESLARALYQEERFGLLDNDHIPVEFQSEVPQHGDVDVIDNEVTIDKAAGITASEELAERSAVLLKNDNSVLPLASDATVNVVGQTSNLLPANPGGEKSVGFGDRATISPLKGLKTIGGSNVSSNPGIDLLGTAVPAANLKVDNSSATGGLTRTTTPVGGGSTTTSVDTVLDGKQTNLVRGETYSWTGYIDVTTADTYQIQLQRPYGKDSGDDSKYNDGITRASGGTVSLSVDGANKTLANPDSNILQNAIPTYASGTSNKILADNGQYLGYDNTGAAVPLTVGRHAITITYAPTTTLPATPTLRLAWTAKNDAVSKAVAAAATNDVSVIFADDAGSTGGDGASTSTDVKALSAEQNSLITQVATAAHANGKKVVVVLNTGSAIRTPWVDQVDGILEMWYPGQEGGTATAKLLYGQANPTGHLTISFPKDSSHTLFTVVDGKNGERSVATQEAGESVASFKWTEGLNVGYRWFTDPSANTQDWDPQFAFGHGLSYTDFDYSNLQTTSTSDGGFDVSFSVTNTGSREGIDAPQVYVGPSSELDPEKFQQTALKLVQFDDVELDAGASTNVSLHVDPSDLSSYSTENNNYVLGTGVRDVHLGAASNDIRLSTTAKVISNGVAPAITKQPKASTTVNAKQTVTLTAEAAGNPAPTVRWQVSTDKGKTWKDLAGESSTTLTFKGASSQSGRQYRAAFTNDFGTAYSNPAKVTVKAVTTTSVKLSKAKVSNKVNAYVTVTVKPTSSKPTGTVTIKYGSKHKTVKLTSSKGGVIKVKLPKLKVGTYKVSAKFSGGTNHVASSSSSKTLKVVKKK